ncbi:hypothetical protein FMUND_14011 [Fusarium mundagurra]|uniref:Uncharacterized protein n=1 Tax=Fusarium mundagurra TaxID=1567541 RepID=A0A8H5XWL5_9HYPO|nr:hypothetical protein FMUND_14011 [Fusarium mundagurra]
MLIPTFLQVLYLGASKTCLTNIARNERRHANGHLPQVISDSTIHSALELEGRISLEAAELTSIAQSAPSETTYFLVTAWFLNERPTTCFKFRADIPYHAEECQESATAYTNSSFSPFTQELAHMPPSEEAVSPPVISCSTYSIVKITASESATETLTAKTNTEIEITGAKAEPLAGRQVVLEEPGTAWLEQYCGMVILLVLPTPLSTPSARRTRHDRVTITPKRLLVDAHGSYGEVKSFGACTNWTSSAQPW